jgi:hypothetical protein
MLKRALFVLSLCLAAGAAAGNPLVADEYEKVVAEIKAMVRTHENKLHEFQVREATPERIERLYRMPELLNEDKVVRENGLIFAGSGPMLGFDKPSDVLGKMERWFPKEFADVRASKDLRFFSHLHAYGPYLTWEAEPAAFMVLWKCMPQVAWIRPGANPFEKRKGDSWPLMPSGARSSSVGEFEFGTCLRERAVVRDAWVEAEVKPFRAEGAAIASRVVPLMARKFERFLAAQRCRGTGPDDCVLVMHMWASLQPDDAALAKALQALEPEVMAGEATSSGSLLRRAAFLRAKLRAVLAAPQAWPGTTLATAFRQMSELIAPLRAAAAMQRELAELDYYNEEVNPWRIVEQASDSATLGSAILAELARLGAPPTEDCFAQSPWLKAGKEALTTEYALLHLADQPRSHCIWPQWEWMAEGASPTAVNLRERTLEMAMATPSGAVRELIVSQLTGNGAKCFGNKPGPGWMQALCAALVSEPQQMALNPGTLAKSERYGRRHFEGSYLDPAPAPARLEQLLGGAPESFARAVREVGQDLAQRKLNVFSADLWSHPQRGVAVLSLELQDNHSTPMFFTLDDSGAHQFSVPGRFPGRDPELVLGLVSDTDHDGKPELWWVESYSGCHGDSRDAQLHLDCSVKSASMGEVDGDRLGYFVRSPPDKAALLAATAANPRQEEPREAEQCNAQLVGAFLAPRLNLKFEGEARAMPQVVCKAHPAKPGLTLAALIHEIRNKRGHLDKERRGFVFAMLDLEGGKVVSLFRETIAMAETDSISSLRLDTGRYNLAPGVRALGVRMDIDDGFHCVQSRENSYLHLFVEEGTKLRRVLKGLPMESWQLVDSEVVCNPHPHLEESSLRSIVVLSTKSEGWNDLQITATREIETIGAEDGQTPPKVSKVVEQTLRSRNKTYVFH